MRAAQIANDIDRDIVRREETREAEEARGVLEREVSGLRRELAAHRDALGRAKRHRDEQGEELRQANEALRAARADGADRGASLRAAMAGATLSEQRDAMAMKELKHGRLAMLAFGGIVTQAGLGHPYFPYV